jgi:NADH-quinone oxidoreductase subunit I
MSGPIDPDGPIDAPAADLPPRSRGVIALLEDNCTSCMLCARECPDWCIYIDAHKETVPASVTGGRERTQNVLDRFVIDYSLCMYCGICIEVCPYDALFWSPEFSYAEPDLLALSQGREELGAWLPTVPSNVTSHGDGPGDVTSQVRPGGSRPDSA